MGPFPLQVIQNAAEKDGTDRPGYWWWTILSGLATNLSPQGRLRIALRSTWSERCGIYRQQWIWTVVPKLEVGSGDISPSPS